MPLTAVQHITHIFFFVFAHERYMNTEKSAAMLAALWGCTEAKCQHAEFYNVWPVHHRSLALLAYTANQHSTHSTAEAVGIVWKVFGHKPKHPTSLNVELVMVPDGKFRNLQS